MMKKMFLILTSISKTIAVTDYGDIDFDLDFYGNAIKYNPQIHPFAFSKRNVQVSGDFLKTKRPVFVKNQMPFKHLSKAI